ncbi:hypothetical protein KM043_018716 [Ampulex compressa]|nr:hypothetical protein KM043_018716 [Ampulex compressa]
MDRTAIIASATAGRLANDWSGSGSGKSPLKPALPRSSFPRLFHRHPLRHYPECRPHDPETLRRPAISIAQHAADRVRCSVLSSYAKVRAFSASSTCNLKEGSRQRLFYVNTGKGTGVRAATMDSFDIYDRADFPEMYTTFGDVQDSDGHSLLDMDSLVTRKSNFSTTHGCEPAQKICTLGETGEENDGTGWSEKPVESWCQEETMNWLMYAAFYMGQRYCSIQYSLGVPGRELVTFTKDDFIRHDPVYGSRLYDLLHSQRTSNLLPPFDSIHPHFEDEYVRIGSNNLSDAESDNSIEISPKRPPGRPRVLKAKKNPTSQGKLWEFIRDLLHNRETCPSLIRWEDYSQAKFRFVKSDEVAKRWGSRKGNTKMTYEKLSRAMRYYYKSKIFQPVLGRRLVYQFGHNAKGWETDNPNFQH